MLAALPAEARAGLDLQPEEFTPSASRHRGRRCHGLRLSIREPDAVAPVTLGLALVRALHQTHPDDFDLDATAGMLADQALQTHIRDGSELHELLALGADDLRRFRRHRSAALLYED